MARTDRLGKTMRATAYLCGGVAFAALTHRFNAEAVTDIGVAVGVLTAALGFLPRLVVHAQRDQMAALIDAKFAELRQELSDDVSTALRHAVELGVVDGSLRRSLGRPQGEPPRPRRLHAVPKNREGA